VDRRQTLPRVWLVTDERMGDELMAAIGRLPPGSGILFRHYSLAEPERRALFDSVQLRARAGGHLLLLAGQPALAQAWGADGWHGWEAGQGLRSASVHNLRELRRAEAAGAALLFISPVYPTRSHRGAQPLGPRRFAALTARARRPVIALGGVTQASAPKLLRLGAYGWAGIDAWLR
jgi:thiamine-phosphate pyrophosphorylase